MFVTKNGKGLGPLTPEEILEIDFLFKEFLQDSMDLNNAESRSMDCMRDWMLKTLEYNVHKGDSDNNNFRLSMERYANIVKCKSTSNIISLPINLALIMAGKDGAVGVDSLNQLNQVLIDIGHYLQVKEDFEEVFGYQVNEKGCLVDHIRTGWVSKELSWLMVQAAQKCRPDKFQELLKIRKSSDAGNSDILRDELERCGVKDEYKEYQNECFWAVMRKIEEVSDGDLKKFLVFLMNDN